MTPIPPPLGQAQKYPAPIRKLQRIVVAEVIKTQVVGKNINTMMEWVGTKNRLEWLDNTSVAGNCRINTM